MVPYLLLVTFYTSLFGRTSPGQIASINQSPYDGVAVPLHDAYDTIPLNETNLDSAARLIERKGKKNFWPWVFFNRFYGFASNNRYDLPRNPYFRRIPVFDLDDKAGALTQFCRIWTDAFRLAKEVGAPGVVVDMEDYNNRTESACDIRAAAAAMGDTPRDLKRRLELTGARLVDIANQEYPGAVIWLLFTGLGQPAPGVNEYRPEAYFVIGMLERAKAIQSRLQFVSGGEISLDYCSRNVAELRSKILMRWLYYSPWLSAFPNLHLAGTVAPWLDGESRYAYFDQGACGESTFTDLNHFQPAFRALFTSYRYMWIYASGNTEYNPYDPVVAGEFNAALQKARSIFWKHLPPEPSFPQEQDVNAAQAPFSSALR